MPAVSSPIFTTSVAATAALTTGRAVSYTGTVPNAGATALGIAETDAAIGEQVAVSVHGTAIAEAGGAFVVGDQLQVGTGGKLVLQTTGTVVARAMQAAAADGDLVEVLLLPR